MPQVFLSRPLRTDSPFLQLKTSRSWTINAFSLLEFVAIPFQEIPVAHWLFFYSPKGVDFFFTQQHKLPFPIQVAAMGPGTAAACKRHGYTPDFIGSGHPNDVSSDFLSLAAQQKVIFVQAKQSRKSVQRLLGSHITAFDLIVYDNIPKSTFKVPNADYLIFTSPLNFSSYLRHYEILPHQRIIGIGPTTAVSFSDAGVTNYRVALQANESALVECLLKWDAEPTI